jgi:ABC-type uncharacterized transport system fused permease/ATPase subunit
MAKYILTIIIRKYYNPKKGEHKVELFLTFIPGLIIIIVATVVLLHKASENKNAEKILINFEKNNFKHKAKIFFIKQIKIFCIIAIIASALPIAHSILSRTVLKEFIENWNNRIIEEALVVKGEIHPILEATHNFPVKIEFYRMVERTTNLTTSGIHEFNVFHQNSKENIRVEWELNEGEVTIKSITKHFGREVVNIFLRE